MSLTKAKYENFEITEQNDFHPKFVGRHRVLKYRNDEILWTLGPHWPFFFCMFTLMLIVSICNLIYITPKYDNPFLMVAFSLVISTIELTLYFCTAISNPGIQMPRSKNLDLEIGTRCDKCHALRFKGSHHCDECDVCIIQWDHHCIWTGKCIGSGNITFFWAFLAWTILFLSYNLGTTLAVYKQL